MKNFVSKITVIALWINKNIVMTWWMFIFSIIFVGVIYGLLPIIGFQKWNSGIGLFSNTGESSFEFITGIGSGLAVYSFHKLVKKHHEDIMNIHAQHAEQLNSLHQKIDKLAGKS